MKGVLPKRIALKVDVIGPEDILFAGASEHFSAWKYYWPGSEGVKSIVLFFYFLFSFFLSSSQDCLTVK